MTNLSTHALERAVEHPAIAAIAVELILNPGRRERYSPVVLEMAERFILRLQVSLNTRVDLS